jgi:hypothetical protein
MNRYNGQKNYGTFGGLKGLNEKYTHRGVAITKGCLPNAKDYFKIRLF